MARWSVRKTCSAKQSQGDWKEEGIANGKVQIANLRLRNYLAECGQVAEKVEQEETEETENRKHRSPLCFLRFLLFYFPVLLTSRSAKKLRDFILQFANGCSA
jgi:hypothetical protein